MTCKVFRTAFAVVLTAAMLAPAVADAKKEKEVVPRLVVVRVVTTDGAPIPNAWVRIPGTEGRRMVDRNGEWEAEMLYTLEGEEMFFSRGSVIDFSISAPGYQSLAARYKVRGRGNVVTVPLARMPQMNFVDDDDAELMIQWFQRTAHDTPVPVSDDTGSTPPGPGKGR